VAASREARKKDEGGPTEADFGEAMHAWQKMSRAFFSPFGKTGHVFLPVFPAKDVAYISRQEVTLLSKLYPLTSNLAMWFWKYVLTIHIYASLLERIYAVARTEAVVVRFCFTLS
jgi:hypothetical protein